ncbi:MAG: cupredoxin domain-containing protein, partial [Actinomycetota bacterium]
MDLAEIVVTAGGVLLSALLAWFFLGPKESSRAELRDGMQEVRVTVKGGYTPSAIRVRQGVPMRVTFDRQEGGECTSEVVFPDLRLRRTLPAFARTTVELLPDRTGEFEFACGMNMVHGRLIVEPAEGNGVPAVDGGDRSFTAPMEEAALATAGSGHTHEAARSVSVEPQGTEEATGRVALAVRGGGAVCPACLRTIESVLEPLPGVRRVDTNVAAERALVEFDPSVVSVADMQKAVASAGYRVEARPEQASEAAEDEEAAERLREVRDLSRRVVIGAVLSAPVIATVMATELFGLQVPEILVNRWVQLALITPVFLYTGWPIHTVGWRTLRHRTADMNTLITVGTTAAYVYSLLVTVIPRLFPPEVRNVYYEVVGVILTLILLGRLLESKAKAGTGEAIRKLLGLRPRTARVVRDRTEQEVP